VVPETDSRFVVEGSCAEFVKRTEALLKHVDHVYYMTWWSRASALFVLAVGSVFCIAVWSGPIFPAQNADLVRLFASAALLLYGFYQTANAFLSTVTLLQGSVEVRTAFSRKSLLFSEIRGRRQYTSMGRYRTAYFKLEPDHDRLYSLAFEQAFTFDEAFFQWFNSLPDLDAIDENNEKDSKFAPV